MESDCDSPSTCNEFLCTDGDDSQSESIISHPMESNDAFHVDSMTRFQTPTSAPEVLSLLPAEATAKSDPEKVKWLLSAIRRIRAQKQRPCVERISCMLRSICRMTQDEVEEQLELAVKDGLIIRVSVNGISSYRDPKMVVSLKTHRLKVSCQSDLLKVVVRTVRDLGAADGSTLSDIHQFIMTGYSVDVAEGCDVRELVSKWCQTAVSCGRLVRNGDRYQLAASPKMMGPSKMMSGDKLRLKNVQALEDKAFQNQVCTEILFRFTVHRFCSNPAKMSMKVELFNTVSPILNMLNAS